MPWTSTSPEIGTTVVKCENNLSCLQKTKASSYWKCVHFSTFWLFKLIKAFVTGITTPKQKNNNYFKKILLILGYYRCYNLNWFLKCDFPLRKSLTTGIKTPGANPEHPGGSHHIFTLAWEQLGIPWRSWRKLLRTEKPGSRKNEHFSSFFFVCLF